MPDIEQALGYGIRILGENRVQEAKKKYEVIADRAVWHMVGHLQTNKVKDALRIFSVIHSLDSLHLANEIHKRAAKPVPCLIEVNTSQEPTKYGVAGDAVRQFYASVQRLDNLHIRGLMTIGPGWAVQDPEASRPCFRLLWKIREDLQREFDAELPVLSMGMTSDFEVAIEEGSTMVRIGTAIFGPRSD